MRIQDWDDLLNAVRQRQLRTGDPNVDNILSIIVERLAYDGEQVEDFESRISDLEGESLTAQSNIAGLEGDVEDLQKKLAATSKKPASMATNKKR